MDELDEIVLAVWTFKELGDTHVFGYATIENAVAFIKEFTLKFNKEYGSDKEFNFFVSDLEKGIDLGYAIVRIMFIPFDAK